VALTSRSGGSSMWSRKDHQRLFAEAASLTPGGGQTRSRTPGHVGPSDTSADFPLFADGAEGAYVIMSHSHRRLLDCFGANAAVPIGHAHPNVVQAVCGAVKAGSLPSLTSRLEIDASRMFLKDIAPWAERVRWVKTGTEALMAAVRLARAYTNRDRVIVMDSSYHGWSDLNDARFTLKGQKNGVPLDTAKLTTEMPYHCNNIIDYVSASKNVAAVIVEPHRWIRTNVEWLRELKRQCTANNVVFIMDEMVYGLRWAKGGATEYYGVQPDLACFGKALGGGIPVALVCGRADIMSLAAQYISGTYFGETLGMTAAIEVMRIYRSEPIIELLWRRGQLTWHGFQTACGGMSPRLDGTHVHWRLLLCDNDPSLMDLIQIEAINQGVLFHKASNNASAAMTDTEAYDAGLIIGRAVSKVLGERV